MKRMAKMRQVENSETTGSRKSLYKPGAAAALLVVVLTLAEIVGHSIYPLPTTASDWFMLFQSNTVIGLLDFWGLEVPMYAMFVLVFLALYVALRKTSQGGMAIALSFVLLGVGIFFATNNPFTMLSLSNQHAAATTDAQRATFLAAGEAVLANTGQRAVGGFNVGLFLVSAAGLIVSSVMRRSDSFNRPTALVGILGHALSLADYLRQALTKSEIVALFVILTFSLLLVVWFVMVGRRLYQLGRLEGKAVLGQS
jgi:hypothetical protein